LWNDERGGDEPTIVVVLHPGYPATTALEQSKIVLQILEDNIAVLELGT